MSKLKLTFLIILIYNSYSYQNNYTEDECIEFARNALVLSKHSKYIFIDLTFNHTLNQTSYIKNLQNNIYKNHYYHINIFLIQNYTYPNKTLKNFTQNLTMKIKKEFYQNEEYQLTCIFAYLKKDYGCYIGKKIGKEIKEKQINDTLKKINDKYFKNKNYGEGIIQFLNSIKGKINSTVPETKYEKLYNDTKIFMMQNRKYFDNNFLFDSIICIPESQNDLIRKVNDYQDLILKHHKIYSYIIYVFNINEKEFIKFVETIKKDYTSYIKNGIVLCISIKQNNIFFNIGENLSKKIYKTDLQKLILPYKKDLSKNYIKPIYNILNGLDKQLTK